MRAQPIPSNLQSTDPLKNRGFPKGRAGAPQEFNTKDRNLVLPTPNKNAIITIE